MAIASRLGLNLDGGEAPAVGLATIHPHLTAWARAARRTAFVWRMELAESVLASSPIELVEIMGGQLVDGLGLECRGKPLGGHPVGLDRALPLARPAAVFHVGIHEFAQGPHYRFRSVALQLHLAGESLQCGDSLATSATVPLGHMDDLGPLSGFAGQRSEERRVG